MSHLQEDRQNKLQDWKDLGFKPYQEYFTRTHTSQEADNHCQKNKSKLRSPKDIMSSDAPSGAVKMCGRIMIKREMGKLIFSSLKDVDGVFQICFAESILDEKFKIFAKILDMGDFIGVEGEFFYTKHGEATLMVFSLTPLSKAIQPLPEKWHGIVDKEKQYRERHLDMISHSETFDRFVLRSKAIKYIRDFFGKHNFLEIETQVLQSRVGGALAKVFKTHHNAFDAEFVLRIALELELKRAVGGGMERVFEIGKCFRNEGTDPSHLQEFTMLEWYAAYADLEQNRKWMEELFRSLAQDVFKKNTFTVKDKEGSEHTIDIAQSFNRASFNDLLQEHANIDVQNIDITELKKIAKKYNISDIDTKNRGILLDDIYKATARIKIIQPTFVFDYPSELKPLAQPKPDGSADCYQLVIAGWEVVNSYAELIDPMIQRKILEEQFRFRQSGNEEAMEVDEVFLKSMEHGFPPMTGCGIGIDRLIALFTHQPNLRDVVLFPTMKEL